MQLIVHPGQSLEGQFGPATTPGLPGDKSISHRAALLAGMAAGDSQIDNFMVSGVTQVLLQALSTLGVIWRLEHNTLFVSSPGFRAWKTPEKPIDCGNSGTTIRLLAGALAAAGIPAVLDGSPSLRRRPMARILLPLQQMGVPISGSVGGYAPLQLQTRPENQPLQAINYQLPVPSAQVKTCLMLAALAAPGETVLEEHYRSRDHTEIMFARLGVEISTTLQNGLFDNRISLTTGSHQALDPLHMELPGDFSSAAFLIVAGLITPGSQILLTNIGLNPTRTGLLDVLSAMGADLHITPAIATTGEAVGSIQVNSSPLTATSVAGRNVVRMIDEFPIFAVAAAYAQGISAVTQAEELRYKESDRITALCSELKNIGATINELPDGFTVTGQVSLSGGTVNPHRDHRLALSLGVAGLAAQQPVVVQTAEIIRESFPTFPQILQSAGANLTFS